MQATEKLITILVPVYNEEVSLPFFLERIDKVVEDIRSKFGFSVELVFTDNCSSDGTATVLEQAAISRPYLRVFRFSRNVGFQRSIISGYALARGDACVQIDCDLEDPPELILDFISAWLEGYKVVYGVRLSRREGLLMRATRGFFYRIVNMLSEDDTPVNAGDFRLIDRRVIDIVCQVNDAEPYLRGLISNLGFRQKGIPFDRDARVAGETKFSLRQYASIAIDGILQSSIRPLNISLWVSVFAFLVSMTLACFYIISKLLGNIQAEGFVTLVVLGLLQFSVLLLVIGINSIYLGRVYRQVFRRPISIIEVTRNAPFLSETDGLVYWPGEPSPLRGKHKNALQNKGQRHDDKDCGSTCPDLGEAEVDEKGDKADVNKI
ncbi:glycosyltransferase family 2 protein [Pseudogemmobacter sp. W21_MBD1_M6]|uniref:glycosyltransferase family 2 protein n=1 Tax=Pseudogemmobacter sp. W21_MBD1_M6 TaxID=3240271 RepID=UPI003F9772A0